MAENFNVYLIWSGTGCSGKIVFQLFQIVSQFTATPPSPTSLKEAFKALNAMRVYSHSYWLVIFCTTNSSRVLARERWQTFENSWKNTIFNEHNVCRSYPLFHYIFGSLYFCLSISLHFCISVSLHLYLYVPHSLCISVCISLSSSLSKCISINLSLYIYSSLPVSLYLYVSLNFWQLFYIILSLQSLFGV